jgi:hypothetical protein
MSSKLQTTEVALQDMSRNERIFSADMWLRAGPLHIPGVLDIITAYTQEFEGICLFTLEGHTGPVQALAVLPDGKLASGFTRKLEKIFIFFFQMYVHVNLNIF